MKREFRKKKQVQSQKTGNHTIGKQGKREALLTSYYYIASATFGGLQNDPFDTIAA